MADDLQNRLSSSDIRKFEQALSKFDASLDRQEEIAKKILDTETNIAKVRLGSLKPYFDAYSKGLDDVIARKTSQLNDAFLIMERKAMESFKKVSDTNKDAITPAGKSKSQSGAAKRNAAKKTPAQTANPETELTASSDKQDSSNKPVSKPRKKQPEKPSNNVPKQETENQKAKPRKSGSGGGGGNKPPKPPKGSPNNDGEPIAVNRELQSDSAIEALGEEANTAENIIARLKAFNEANKTAEEQLNAITDRSEKKQADAVIKRSQLYELLDNQRKKRLEEYEQNEKDLADTLTELALARMQANDQYAEKQEFLEAKAKDIQIARIQDVTEAELAAQNLINEAEAKREYSQRNPEEDHELKARKTRADNDQKSIQQIEEKRTAYIARKELEAKRKNNGILNAAAIIAIQKHADKRFKLDNDTLEKLNKKREEHAAALANKEQRDLIKSDINTLKTGSWEERKEAVYNLTHDESGNVSAEKIASSLVNAIGDYAKKLETKIDEIASYKSAIDTRLQGSSNKTSSGSYWDQIVKDMTSIGAVNPYYKQSDFANNIKSLVDQGIAFDLEQRAFLMTIQSKIANTFDVADGTLLRLIRIQQEDTTAGRLGMEAALNSFLNSMYENTEYLKQVADSVRGSLAEMQSLMSGAEAAEVEYQVQKWMGSLYSVGMSDAAVNSISSALGQIAAGQIEGLINGGAGNLIVMAANDAGLSIADILTEGLDSSKTNALLNAVVNYLAEIAESSKGNNVVQQQLAGVFGVKASDLRAVTNLTTQNSVSAIYDNSRTYGDMLSNLTTLAGSMSSRTSLSEMMTNIWENVQYSMAGSMASNPVTYFMYKVASVLDDTVGGIAIPAVSVLGNMVDLETTVADLMRVGAMAGGVIGSFGDLVSGLSNSFSGQAMLSQLGISSGSGIAVTPRGDGGLTISATGGGSSSTSGSGYVGNAASSDIKNATMQEAKDTKKQLMVEAQEEEEANQINVLNSTVLKIYELLDDVAHGSGYFRVKVENYGLTKASPSSAQGGVGALGDYSGSGGSGGSASGGSLSGSGGSVNYGGIGGSIDFGGWTTVG